MAIKYADVASGFIVYATSESNLRQDHKDRVEAALKDCGVSTTWSSIAEDGSWTQLEICANGPTSAERVASELQACGMAVDVVPLLEISAAKLATVVNQISNLNVPIEYCGGKARVPLLPMEVQTSITGGDLTLYDGLEAAIDVLRAVQDHLRGQVWPQISAREKVERSKRAAATRAKKKAQKETVRKLLLGAVE